MPYKYGEMAFGPHAQQQPVYRFPSHQQVIDLKN